MAFFPSAEEKTALTTISKVVEWVGLSEHALPAVEVCTGSLGDKVRNMALLPAIVIREVAGAAKLAVEGDTPRPLSPIEAAQIGLVWRICCRLMSADWSTWIDVDPLAAPPIPAAASPAPAAATGLAIISAKKLKMSNVLDQGDESEFAMADPARIAGWFHNYVSVTHGQPDEEDTPTNEQLTALYVRVVAQQGSPYADFAVFTPFARKTSRAHRFTAYLPQPDGSWLSKEIPGPKNYEAWLFCWRVCRVACLMLKLAHEMPLDRYQRKIEKLATQWGSAWHLVCLAEDKCRFEHMNRLKARIDFDLSLGRPPPPLWDAAMPWSAIFLKAAEDDEAFWDDNVRHPAMSWLAHGSRGAPRLREELVADLALSGGSAALTPETRPSRGAWRI